MSASANSKEIIARVERLLEVANNGAQSGRALDIALNTLRSNLSGSPENEKVYVNRLQLDAMMDALHSMNTSWKIFQEYYIKQVEMLRTSTLHPTANFHEAQKLTADRLKAQLTPMAPAASQVVNPDPKKQYDPGLSDDSSSKVAFVNAAPRNIELGTRDTANTAPTLELPAAPVNPAPADLTPSPVIDKIMRLGGALQPKELEQLMQPAHMVPPSATAELEFPSTSPMAKFFYNADGIYQHREGFARHHIDPVDYEVKDWLSFFPEGAYGKRNAVDEFDTPTAIVVRMDDDGIAVMWNPVINSYRIFYMDLQLDASQPGGFKHRWISHKNFTPSHMKNILTKLKLRLGQAE